MIKIFLIISFYLTCALSYAQGDTIVFSIVSAGNIKGSSKEWRNVDGSYTEVYQYNDRGRGDSIVTIYKEDKDGFPTYIKARGKDYMKNNVEEDFSLTNGVAKWTNNAENEQMNVSGKKFYSALKSSGGHFIKAMKSNGNKLQMLPFGETEIVILQSHTLHKGSVTRKVWLVETKGFGLTPTYSWIDDKDNMFAYVDEWQSNILAGYEPFINELLSIQKKYQSNFYNNLAKTIPQKLKGPLLIRNVSIFNALTARMELNKDVLIVDGIIKDISSTGTTTTMNAEKIDGTGKTLLPGLWDMHVHFADDLDGVLHIAAGVTHVRDMGSSETLLERIRQVNEGTLIGPRVEIRSGFIDGAGKFAAPTGTLINNIEEGKKAIKDYATKGYQQIKLYSSLKPEWVKPLIDEAKLNHLKVAGHIPAFMTATQAVKAGYNEITHMNMLALNFFGDTIDTRSPLRFSIPAERTASLDLNGAAFNEFMQLLKTNNVAVDPTLGVFENLFLARDKITPAKFTTIVNKFPLQWQRNIKAGGGGIPVPEGMDDIYQKSFDKFLSITKMLYDNGITIVAGTDGLPGFDLHRELELYVKAGIPANEVLQIATYKTAKYVGMDKDFGSIIKGKPADLVLIEGDPTNDISNVRNTLLIITQGKIFDAGKLYKSVSIKHR